MCGKNYRPAEDAWHKGNLAARVMVVHSAHIINGKWRYPLPSESRTSKESQIHVMITKNGVLEVIFYYELNYKMLITTKSTHNSIKHT